MIDTLRGWHFRLLLKYPGWFLALFLLLTLATGYGFTKFGIDVSSAPFFPKNDPATRTLENFHETFPAHETIFLAVEFPETAFAEEPVEHLERLTEAFSGVAHVSSVWSMVNVDTLAEHLVASKNWNGLRRYMLDNPRYRSSLVSVDGRSAVIVMSPPPERRETEQDRALVQSLYQLLDKEKQPGTNYYLSGMPIIKVEFSDLIMKDQRVFGFLAAVLLSLFMALLFRTFWGVVVPLACGGLSVWWTLGLFFMTGHRINLVSSVLSLVIVVISMANCIHLINYFVQRFKRDGNKEGALKEALKYALLPCLVSTVTTIMGFLSLTTSEIPAVVDFVLFASLGILISFLLTGTLVPILLYRWVDMPSARRVPLDRGFVAWILEKILWLVANRRFRVVLASLIIFSVLGYGIRRVHSTMDVMSSFPKDSPLREATVFLQEELSGAHVLEIMITSGINSDLLSIDNLRKVEAFERFLQQQPEVNRSLSALLFAWPYLENYLSAPGELKKIMPMASSFRSTLAMLHPSQRELLRVFIDREYRTFRITVFLNTADSRMVTNVAKRIREEGKKILGPEMQTRLTGELLLFSRISTDMVGKLLKSLFQAFGIIFLGIGLMFRSVKAVLVSVLPNLFPIVSLFGIMGWLGIPLSVPTSIVACIALGLAVDDTAHFLHNYKERQEAGAGAVDAARTSLATVGRAMIFTSLILVMGFWLGLMSPFDIIVQFGFLAGMTVLIALWCDLTLLPICLMLVERMFRPKKAAAASAALIAVVCILFAQPSEAVAQAGSGTDEQITLRLATLAPEGTPWADAARETSRLVKEKTKGRISIKWYLGAVMGDEKTMLARIRSGSLQGAVVSMAGLSQISPAVTLLGLPLLFRDVQEAGQVAHSFSPVLEERFLQKGFALTGWFALGFGRLFTVTEADTLEKLIRLRVWTWKGDPLGEMALKALGFKNLVPLEMTDVMPALQYDLLDAFSGTYYSITVLQWFPYAHYAVPLNWTYALGGLVISEKAFSALTRTQQSVLRDVMGNFTSRLMVNALRSEQDADRGMVEKQGLKKIHLKPDEVARLEERARNFYRELAVEIQEEKLLEDILGTLAGIRSRPAGKQ